MNMKRLIKASMLFMVATLFAACASEDIAQDKKKENGTEAPKGGVIFSTGEPKNNAKHRLAGDAEVFAKTRTSITHTPGGGADAYWTSSDNIWVKDKNGNWQQSIGIELHDGGASAEFTLPGNKADYADGCEVRYTGISGFLPSVGKHMLVSIATNQSRSAANDFSRAGDWGDCGSGVAHNTGNPDKFNFTLVHKSSYLCFLPRCGNAALAPNVKLMNIKITVLNGGPISGLFIFDGENIGTGTPPVYNNIKVTLQNFPLSTTANQTANTTYLAIPPGTYDFLIDYTIRDWANNVEGSVVQTLTNVTLNKGEINDVIYDITPQTPVPVPVVGSYYMWDAVNPFWYGYESFAPTVNGGQGQHYPDKDYNPGELNNRWFHEGSGVITASQSCAICPNVNELCWYVTLGDPHWQSNIAVSNGHLVANGGVWLKKKAAIIRDNSGSGQAFSAANGGTARFSNRFPSNYQANTSPGTDTDWRITPGSSFPGGFLPIISSSSALSTPGDYFFLPTTGSYGGNILVSLGELGQYWSSNAHPQQPSAAYILSFSRFGGAGTPSMYVGRSSRRLGLVVRAFE